MTESTITIIIPWDECTDGEGMSVIRTALSFKGLPSTIGIVGEMKYSVSRVTVRMLGTRHSEHLPFLSTKVFCMSFVVLFCFY